MNYSTSSQRASLALLLVSFGLVRTPAPNHLSVMEILSPDADTASQLMKQELAAVSEVDAAYVRAMQARLEGV